jgi:hypothetical protein
VVERIATESVRRRTQGDGEPNVQVRSASEAGLDLSIELALPYPRQSLSSLLSQVRAEVAEDLQHLVGWRVRRLDLIVDRLVVRRAARRNER